MSQAAIFWAKFCILATEKRLSLCIAFGNVIGTQDAVLFIA
jgi:hypothetical protein